MRGFWACLTIACSVAACSGTSSTDCGAGQQRDVDGVAFCVYQQSVVIEEGFQCPPEMTLYDELDGDLAVCGPEGQEELAIEAVREERATSNWVVSEPTSIPTYRGTIAGIFAERCSTCHQPDGERVDLGTYESAAANAVAIGEQVSAGTMPAWAITNDGSCGSFSHAVALSAAERQDVLNWVGGGTPEGPASASLPVVPAFEADVAALAESVVVSAGESRCFPLATVADDDVVVASRAHTVTGIDSMSLHAVGAMVAANAMDLDAMDPAPGYACPQPPLAGGEMVTGWLPGPAVTRLPDGLGMELAASKLLILRISASSDVDAASIGFELEVEDVTTAMRALTFEVDLVLPPGQTAAAALGEVAASELFGGPVRIHGYFPSGKERLRSLRFDAGPVGNAQCGFERKTEIFRDWSTALFPDAPLTVQPQDLLRLRCEFDTSGDTATVRQGALPGDEVCRLSFIVEDL